MDGGQFSSWRPTGDERRRAFSAAMQVASTFVGPLGPLFVWAFEYIYDRRDLIFNQLGIPTHAYTADGSPLGLGSLAAPDRTAWSGTLSIRTTLTDAARLLGLRGGDPVSVVLSSHGYVHARSRLVVPTRIGEQRQMSVPNGSYSLAVFGSRRDALFAAPDPYSTVAGGNVLVSGRCQLDLPLTDRSTVAGQAATDTSHRLVPGNCARCGQPTGENLLTHTLNCPTAVYQCPRCGKTFQWVLNLVDHEREAHTPLRTRFARFLDQL
jgi:DNA-directed RNA polymerase subunit RPC12/RpoP